MAVAVSTHPFASVTVTTYVPALNPVIVCVVSPPGLQEYVYGGVPPVGLAVAVPSPVVGPVSSVAVAVTLRTVAGSVIVILCSTGRHNVPSILTLTVYTPAVRLLIVLVVTPE